MPPLGPGYRDALEAASAQLAALQAENAKLREQLTWLEATAGENAELRRRLELQPPGSKWRRTLYRYAVGALAVVGLLTVLAVAASVTFQSLGAEIRTHAEDSQGGATAPVTPLPPSPPDPRTTGHFPGIPDLTSPSQPQQLNTPTP